MLSDSCRTFHQHWCNMPASFRTAQVVSADGYHRFTEEGNMVAWESLIICTRPSSIAEEAPCPICFDQISTDKYFLTGCKHAFHKECLAAWQQYASPASCPMCRGTLTAVA